MNDQALTVIDSAPIESPAPVAMFGNSPAAVIANATSAANALKAVLKSQGLITVIQGKEYPRCEAWTLLGTMVGMFPVLVWSKPIEGGWEARVEAKLRDGTVVGAAEAQCTRSEKTWSNRDDYAIRSMAQTRATAKALRMPLGFVMTLAGYEPTPAEEMPQQHIQQHEGRTATHAPSSHTTSAPKPAKAALSAQGEAKGSASPNPEACKARFLEIIREKKWEPFAWKMAVDEGAILPTERLDDAKVDWFPKTKIGSDEKLREIKAVMDAHSQGGISQELAEAFDKAYLELPIGAAEFDVPDTNDDDWKYIAVPQWSKHFKEGFKTFGDLDDKQLWWWAVKWQPTGYKGKPPKKEDVELRRMLDAVRSLKNFTE